MADRNLDDVIAQMIKLIPAERDALVQRLRAVERKVPYCPPESSGTLWRLCCAVLVEEIGRPQKDWEVAVADLFSGKNTATPMAEVKP